MISFLFYLLLPFSCITSAGWIIINIAGGCSSLFALTHLALNGIIYKAVMLDMVQSDFPRFILGCLITHYGKLLLDRDKVRIGRGIDVERFSVFRSVLVVTVTLPH